MNKATKPFIGCIFLAIFFTMMFTRQYFTLQRPESPQPERGWTYPVSANYCKTVYVAASERTILLFTSEWGFVALFALLGVVVWVVNKKNSN